MRVLGDNSAGFANEKEIKDALNSRRYDDINANLRHFLDCMFKGFDLRGKWVHATTIPQRMKPDFYVTVDGVPQGKYVSVKMGSGNSIHQESFEDFICFLISQNVPMSIINDIKLYHWSDDTLDNTGYNRVSSKEFSKNNPDVVKRINDFFSKKEIVIKLFNRFVFAGNYPEAPSADYLYHGDLRSGVWASKKEILDYIGNLIVDKTCVSFGPLTYQAWNKNLGRNPTMERRRYQMQIKWGSLEETLIDITSRRDDYARTGSFEGEMSEKASIISFNRNPTSGIFSSYLQKINVDANSVLLIRVTTNQMSRLSNQRVKTRADAYAIEVIDHVIYDLLEENDFYLDETILDGYDNLYRCIEKSGISIKKDDSDSYSLIKLTPNSFNELFGNYVLGYGASLFVKRNSELYLNEQLLAGWHVSIEEVQDYYGSNIVNLHSLTHDLELCKNIKDLSIRRIKDCIDGSLRIQSIIFNGKEIYDEPYTAFFFMQNNIIRLLTYIPYSITTGSGRSHGDYSIVLKPR